MNRARVVSLAGIAALGGIVAACGNGSTGGYGSAADQAAGQPGAVRLKATRSAELGTIVTDARGFTLYRSDADTAKPPDSNCSGRCAAMWPPVLAGPGPLDLSGIDAAAVGTVLRSDGGTQLTI